MEEQSMSSLPWNHNRFNASSRSPSICRDTRATDSETLDSSDIGIATSPESMSTSNATIPSGNWAAKNSAVDESSHRDRASNACSSACSRLLAATKSAVRQGQSSSGQVIAHIQSGSSPGTMRSNSSSFGASSSSSSSLGSTEGSLSSRSIEL